MNPQKNQVAEGASLLSEIQTEISAESAPLLRFILRYANIIAVLIVSLLLLVAGTGLWQCRSSAKNAEVMDELARIVMTKQGEDRTKALSALVLVSPDKTKSAIYMALGQSAVESGEYAVAAAAYADAARQDSEGSLGTSAMIAQACVLLKEGKSVEAVPLLQEAEKRLPEQARTPQLRKMLAEAAIAAGRKDLAISIYNNLAALAPDREGDYFRARAAALEQEGKP